MCTVCVQCTVFFLVGILQIRRKRRAEESKYYLHIYYIYYYIVLYINTLYIIIYIIIKNIIIHNNSFSHSLPPIGGHENNCNLYTLYTFHSSLPEGGVHKKNCKLYTLYTFTPHYQQVGYRKKTVICTHCTHFTLHFQEVGYRKKTVICTHCTHFTLHLPTGGVRKNNCKLYTLYTFSRMFNPQQFWCFGWLTISLSLLRSLVIGRQSLRLRNKVEQVIGRPKGATLAYL